MGDGDNKLRLTFEAKDLETCAFCLPLDEILTASDGRFQLLLLEFSFRITLLQPVQLRLGLGDICLQSLNFDTEKEIPLQ